MEPLDVFTGIVVPLDRSNVDTDQIIPKQFLKKIERTGFGVHLFHDWRFLDDKGEEENPDFPLNHPRYKGASILLARDNFGCGSSREHAPWALLDYGIRVLIAPSFADIFFNNCFKNGMLPVVLDTAQVQELFDYVEAEQGAVLTVDLSAQEVRRPDGVIYTFSEIDPFRKECLLNGWDDIELTLKQADRISAFESRHESARAFYFFRDEAV